MLYDEEDDKQYLRPLPGLPRLPDLTPRDAALAALAHPPPMARPRPADKPHGPIGPSEPAAGSMGGNVAKNVAENIAANYQRRRRQNVQSEN